MKKIYLTIAIVGFLGGSMHPMNHWTTEWKDERIEYFNNCKALENNINDVAFKAGNQLDIDVAQLFLSRKLNINTTAYKNYTMLNYALSFHSEEPGVSAKEKLDFIKFLLENGAKIAEGEKKETIEAIQKHSKFSTEIMNLLARFGMD